MDVEIDGRCLWPASSQRTRLKRSQPLSLHDWRYDVEAESSEFFIGCPL